MFRVMKFEDIAPVPEGLELEAPTPGPDVSANAGGSTITPEELSSGAKVLIFVFPAL